MTGRATCWAVILLAAAPQLCLAISREQAFTQGVAAYREGLDAADRNERVSRFRRAETLFSQAIHGDETSSGNTGSISNAELYVNLGNAALGAERLGPAILAYRRALLIDPDHRQARQNLQHARSTLPDWTPRPSEDVAWGSFWADIGRLSSSELFSAAALFFFAFAILLSLSIRSRQAWLRNLSIVAAVLWAAIIGIALFKDAEAQQDAAVVIVPEVVARSADSVGAPPRLSQPLPSGTEAQVVEQRGEWTRVRLYDGRDVWLPQSSLDMVAKDGGK